MLHLFFTHTATSFWYTTLCRYALDKVIFAEEAEEEYGVK